MLELAKLSLEVLAEIAALLPGAEVIKLTYICGDSMLRSKMFRSAKELSFKGHQTRLRSLRFMHDFKELLSVSLLNVSPVDTMSLYDLPPQLRVLHIAGFENLWSKAKPSPSLVEMPGTLYLHAGQSAPFNFKAHFTSLRHLSLTGYTHIAPRCLIDLLPRFLPLTLETFAGTELGDPYYWKHMPAGLEINCKHPLTVYQAKRFIEFAPHVHLNNVIASEPDPAFALLNARTVTLTVIQPYLRPPLQPFFAAFPQTGLPPLRDTSSSSHIPHRPYLISVDSHLPEASLQNGATLQWPESCRTLLHRSKHYGKCTALTSNNLPPNITTLQDTFDTAGPQDWPSSITSLHLVTRGKDWVVDLGALPGSLCELYIDTGAPWSHRFTHKLPRDLKTLSLTVTWPSNSLNAEFVENIPPRLTSLQTNARCDDRLLKLLPKTITKLELESVFLSGHIPLPPPPTFDQTRRVTFHRSDQGNLELEYDKTSTIKFIPLTLILPATLTSITLNHFEPTPNLISPSSRLPNLTRLELYDYARWPLDPGATPSLTCLSVCQFSTTTDLRFPPAITHLINRLHYSTEMPSNLLPQLRIFEALYHLPSAKNLALLTHLDNLTFDEAGDWPIDTTFEATSLRLISQRAISPANGTLSTSFPKLQRFEWTRGTLTDDFTLPPSVTFAQFRDWHITADKHSLSLSSGTIIGDSLDFNNMISEMVAKSLHYELKVTRETKLDGFAFERNQWREFGQLLHSHTITTIKIGKGITVHPRFGQWLPSTVTSLNVLTAEGINGATPNFLPRSITKLKIPAESFPSYSYRQLPPGLTYLRLSCNRFVSRYAALLPSSLLTLKIKGLTQVGHKALLHMPSSITSLTLDPWYPINEHILHGVTPTLRYLEATLDFYQGVLNLQQLIPTLRELGVSPRNFNPEDILRELDKVEF